MLDSLRHKGERRRLIQSLHSKGITDERVLQAMMKVPRHLFMDSAFLQHAYQDKAFPIGAGQTISQPFTVAFQSQLLDAQPGNKILEVGTGSGYQTAVLVALKTLVYTIERQHELYVKSAKTLKQINLLPKFQSHGDGYKGLPTFGPFDGIIVTAGAPKLPQELLKQLKIGAKLVLPLGAEEQIMKTYTKLSENEFKEESHGAFRFVPLLPDRE